MRTYIDGLEEQLHNNLSSKEWMEAIVLLEKEAIRCINIRDQYRQREIDTWVVCDKSICDYEDETVNRILNILDSIKKN